jgi:2-polyprenyl-6-methoxyphenol hydroxylase-like FAD-dependent oxidoreductase
MKNRNVLISGAGPAGLTLAYWLSRYGFTPTVAERAPAVRDGGQAVDIRGAAIEVARRAGILDAVRQARTRTRGMSYVSATGRPLATTNGAFGIVDAEDVEIGRGELTAILYEAVRNDAEFIFDDSITTIAKTPDAVEVTFERSGPGAFHLVVGADGLHSKVRELAFGPEAQFIRHLGLYLSVFTVPNELGLDQWQLIHVVPGKSVTVTSTQDSSQARAIFFFGSPPLDYDYRDVGQQQGLLQTAFTGQSWEIPRLLAAMREAPDFYFDAVSQIRMGRWSAGRVALTGDAGYCPSPLSGQGTSLALVGAYLLAAELCAADGEHRAAFASHCHRIQNFVTQNQQLAVGNASRFVPAKRRQIWLQNQAIRALPYMPGKSFILKQATKGVRDAANAIELPEDQPQPVRSRACPTGRVSDVA